MATVLLIRHGRTTANAAGVLAGWTPGIALDDRGREQALDVGRRCAEGSLHPARVVSSPLQRCVETAGIVVSACAPGMEVVVEDGLGECRYGAWTGRPLAELAKEPLWRVVQDTPSQARFPDAEHERGESIAEMSARAVAAVRRVDAEVRAEHGEGAVWVAVSHADVIKAVLAEALGLPLDRFQRLVVDPASASVVRYAGERAVVLTVNSTGALDGLAGPEQVGATGDVPVGGGAGPAAGPGAGRADGQA